MFDFLTSESILSLSVGSAGLMSVAGIVAAVRTTRPEREKSRIDIEAVVREAPFARLDNIVPRLATSAK